jgi:hypothetical protein
MEDAVPTCPGAGFDTSYDELSETAYFRGLSWRELEAAKLHMTAANKSET